MNSITIQSHHFKFLFAGFLLTVCLLISNIGFSQTKNSNATAGVLTFDSEVIDYGTIQQNADGIRVFSFKNTGDTPIVISNVKTSCGCTVPTYPKTAILPGDSGEISVKYATNRVGAFSKSITVMSNASEAKKVLKIKGVVLKNDVQQ